MKELADKVREAADELSAAMQTAENAGLNVSVEISRLEWATGKSTTSVSVKITQDV